MSLKSTSRIVQANLSAIFIIFLMTLTFMMQIKQSIFMATVQDVSYNFYKIAITFTRLGESHTNVIYNYPLIPLVAITIEDIYYLYRIRKEKIQA